MSVATKIYISAGGRPRDVAASEKLWEIAGNCGGMSGRTLRRLPVLAHARHIGVSSVGGRASSVEVWLKALGKVVQEESTSRGAIKETSI